jgi:hypothetical protein
MRRVFPVNPKRYKIKVKIEDLIVYKIKNKINNRHLEQYPPAPKSLADWRIICGQTGQYILDDATFLPLCECLLKDEWQTQCEAAFRLGEYTSPYEIIRILLQGMLLRATSDHQFEGYVRRAAFIALRKQVLRTKLEVPVDNAIDAVYEITLVATDVPLWKAALRFLDTFVANCDYQDDIRKLLDDLDFFAPSEVKKMIQKLFAKLY